MATSGRTVEQLEEIVQRQADNNARLALRIVERDRRILDLEHSFPLVAGQIHDATLAAAAAKGGTRCQTCEQHAQVYRRRMTANMGMLLCLAHRRRGLTGGWFHAQRLLQDGSGDFAKLRHWGLVIEEPVARPDGGRSGWWQLLPLGREFARGVATVPSRAVIYNGRLVELEGPDVGVRDVLGVRFNYDELMRSRRLPLTIRSDMRSVFHMTTTETSVPVYVDPFPGRKGSERVVEVCGKCGGDGIYHAPSSMGNECFDCDGTGRYSYLVSSARATARRHIREAAARAAETVAAAARLDAWVARYEGLAAHLAALEGIDGELHGSLRGQIARKGELSEAQNNMLIEVVQRHEEREAKKAREATDARPVVVGRVVVTGEIVGVKSVPGYGYHAPDVTKIVVRDDRGFKVYGTCPKSLLRSADDEGFTVYGSVERGGRVTFTATVEASDRDETFGFFLRAAKAARL